MKFLLVHDSKDNSFSMQQCTKAIHLSECHDDGSQMHSWHKGHGSFLGRLVSRSGQREGQSTPRQYKWTSYTAMETFNLWSRVVYRNVCFFCGNFLPEKQSTSILVRGHRGFARRQTRVATMENSIWVFRLREIDTLQSVNLRLAKLQLAKK